MIKPWLWLCSTLMKSTCMPVDLHWRGLGCSGRLTLILTQFDMVWSSGWLYSGQREWNTTLWQRAATEFWCLKGLKRVLRQQDIMVVQELVFIDQSKTYWLAISMVANTLGLFHGTFASTPFTSIAKHHCSKIIEDSFHGTWNGMSSCARSCLAVTQVDLWSSDYDLSPTRSIRLHGWSQQRMHTLQVTQSQMWWDSPVLPSVFQGRFEMQRLRLRTKIHCRKLTDWTLPLCCSNTRTGVWLAKDPETVSLWSYAKPGG